MKSTIGGVVLGCVGVALFAACGDESSSAPGTDAGPTPARDATAPELDAATQDGGVTDAGDAGAQALVPVVLSSIATGRHARLFNVVTSATGTYAVGQAGSAVDPDDMATLIVKLTPAGTLDTSFASGGVLVQNLKAGKGGELARGIVVQSTGKIVVYGTVEHGLPTETTRDMVVARFNPNGTLDTSFGTGGVKTLVLTGGESVATWGLTKYSNTNEDLLLVGARKQAIDAAAPINEMVVIRLSGVDGAVDNTFGPNSDGTFSLGLATNQNPKTATLVPPDNKILVSAYTNAGGNKPVVVKLNANGTRDTSFATNGVFFPETGVPGLDPSGTAEAYAATLQGTKIVTTGYGREVSTQPAVGWISLRLSENGAVDTTYGTNGHVFFGVNGQPANSQGMTVLSDKRLVLVGRASPPKPSADAGNQSQHAAIAVLTENGAFDPTLTPGGPQMFDLGGPATGRAAHVFWAAAQSTDLKHVFIVGLKGGLTANADAGVVGGFDEAAALVVPTGL